MEISSTDRGLTMPHSFYIALDSLATSDPQRQSNPTAPRTPQRDAVEDGALQVSTALSVSPIIKGQRPLSTQKWTAVWLTHGRCHTPDTASADAGLREYFPGSWRRRSGDNPHHWVRSRYLGRQRP